MSESGKHILVTGGAGYIGAHACKALAAAGHLPVTFDNLSQGHEWAVKWGPLVRGDLRDAAALDAAFAAHAIDGVIHFAASCYVGESVSDPAAYWHNNVYGSWCLLEAMRRAGCDKLVFSSTCATYGTPQRVPIVEDENQQPVNPYGQSKLAVERMLADYAAAYGLKSISFRYFNAAGADPDGEIGEAHDPEPHLVPRLLDVALGHSPAAEVYGNDYPTPDGSCIRDYVHVLDLAEAHVAGIERLLEGGPGGAWNLGTGQGSSVLEMIRLVEQMTGRPVPFEIRPRRIGDPPRLVADPTAVRRALDWQARFGPDEIIATAMRWQQTGHAASRAPHRREQRS